MAAHGATLTGWTYRARTIDGQMREGVIQAPSLDDATRALVRNRLIPEWVRPAPKPRSFQVRRSAKPKSLALFTRQLATLIDAGVPVVQSLEIAQDLSDDKALKKALEQVTIDLQSGKGLAGAMKTQPAIFNDVFINMVDAGEQGGMLDTILERLASYLEKSQELVGKVKTAMVYPAIIFFVAISSAAVMLTFVVPTFEGMFSSGGLSLPYPTQVLVNMSDFVQNYWLVMLAVIVGAMILIRQSYKTPPGRLFFDGLLLRVPVLGDLLRKTAVARFSQSMSSLLTAGTNLIDSLVASAATANNVVIEQALLRSRPAIEAGEGISGPLSQTGVIPRLVARMVQVGEQTGRLDEMFDKVAIFYESEVDTAVQRLMKALEPALIVVVGVILGGMVVALYLPIFEALTSVGN